LSNIAGQIFVVGSSNAGVDSIILNDQSNSISDSWAYGDNAITRPGFGGLIYNFGIENITINGGSAGTISDCRHVDRDN